MLKPAKVLLLLIVSAILQNDSFIPAVSAQEGWKNEFEELCGKTQDAAGLANDELKSLISRCDSLKPQLEKLSEPQRKITLRRLQMCRELYFFVLQSKEKP